MNDDLIATLAAADAGVTMSDLAGLKLRVEKLIAQADRVEITLATREWIVRQQSLLLEDYLQNAAEIQRLFDERLASLKSSNWPATDNDHRLNAKPGRSPCNENTSPVRSKRKEAIRRS